MITPLRRLFSRLLFVLTLCVAGPPAFSQQYNFLHYSVSEGLPQSQVNCIYQDAQGFMWIGTEGGAARFDGKYFSVFDSDNGLLGNSVRVITESDDAILLVGDSGISMLSEGKLSPLRFDPSLGIERVRCSARGLNGELLFGTNKGVLLYDNGRLKKMKFGVPVDIVEVRTIALDSKGRLWIGTDRNGLYQFSYSAGGYRGLPFSAQSDPSVQKIRGVVERENGELWIATSGYGLFSFDGTSYTQLKLPERMQGTFFTSAARDKDGNLWFGTWGSGVVKYEQSIFKVYDRRNGLNDDVISALAGDREGNVWLGSQSSGVMVYSGEQFSKITPRDGLPEEHVRSILHDESGNVWMGTFGGLARFDGFELSVLNEKSGLSYDAIGALATDHKGKIFIGTLSGEINVLENGRFTTYKDREQLPAGEIVSLAYGRDASLWIGTVSAGLVRFRDGKFERVAAGGLLERNPVWSLYEDTTGTLWLGTERGVLLLENGNPRELTGINRKPPRIKINAITGDETYMYFATFGNGIWRYHRTEGKLQFIDKKEGLGSNYACGFLWLNEGKSLLVTHLGGLDRIDFVGTETRFRHFGKQDGLGGGEFQPGALSIGKDGKIWMGTSSGAIVYDPSAERRRNTVPVLVLRNLWLMNEQPDWSQYADSVQVKSGLPGLPQLPHDKNYLSFEFSAIQFGTGVNIRYQYKLDGYDVNWSLPTESGTVAYSNLPPGDYRLLVKAGNSSNAWSDEYAFAFTILPPFWKTWWFFLLLLLVIASACIFLMMFFRRGRNEFLARRESEYMLSASRMVLFVSAVLYPLNGVLCMLFDNSVRMQLWMMILIGFVQAALSIASYYNAYVRRNLTQLMSFTYPLLVFHLLYLNYINHLSPVTVTALIIVLSALGIVVDSWRSLAIIGVFVLLFAGWLGFSVDGIQFNPWLFVVGVLSALLLSALAVLVRFNMFNRLIFADTAVNSSWSIVLAADPSGKIVFASRSVRYLLGYTEDELMGDGWWKLRSEDVEENERVKKKIMELSSRQGQSSSYVTSVKTKSGKKRWIQWVDTVLDNGLKVGIGQDVTDRREMEQRYRHIVEAATDIIYTTDFRGKFTFVNDLGARLTGFSREELANMDFAELLTPAHREEVLRFYERQFRRRTVSSYHEFPILHKEGHELWVGQTVRALFDEHRPGYIRGFQAIARDITEKKRYEEELEKLSLVASETINGVLISDPENCVEWVNEGFSRITGYGLRDIKGKRIGDVLAGDKTDLETIEIARRKTARGDGFIIELQVYHKDGRELWISISNTPIVDENGKMLKQIEIFTDITEKKHYEEQLNRYSMRLEILNKTKQDILESQTIEEMTGSALLNLGRRITYCSRLSLAVFDRNRGMADLFYTDMKSRSEMERKEYSLADFRSLPALEQNKHMLVHDLEVEEILSGTDRDNINAGVRSYLIMPLFSQGELIGSINLGSSKAHAISEDDIQLVREVADSLAIAIQQMRYREIIVQKNKDISDSINYAKRIQEAILPPPDLLLTELKNAFALYRPKDVLSGDFYWVETKNGLTFAAVADCTGHGVPGALLSLMGHNLLSQAVQERLLNRPAAVLDFLNAGIQHTLNQYKSAGEMLDGMDIALCVFDPENKRLFYSGAVNPLWIVRDGVLIEVRGDRYSIGSYSETPFRFSNHEVELKTGDMIYMFSDGFADQFGGPNYKKFSYARLRETLTKLSAEEIAVQQSQLANVFDRWKNGNTQTDDVCVIGIRI